MIARLLRTGLILGISLLFASAIAEAQSNARSFVSGTGSDANPCTRAAPCQTLRTAMNQTIAAGEIYVLDGIDEVGLFGFPVTISKSLSIIAAGGRVGITGQVNVAPEAGGQVLLKGLDVQAAGTSGILVQTAGINLVIDDCTIVNGVNGITFEPSGTGTSNLVVRNSVVSRNTAGANGGLNTGGIFIQPVSPAKAVAVIENVNVNNNILGIRAFDNSTVTVRNSVVTQSTWAGIRSEATAGGPVSVFVEHSQVSHNGGNGVLATGATAVLRITDVTITNNAVGVAYANGGTVCSFGNNAIAGNPTTSPPTACPLT